MSHVVGALMCDAPGCEAQVSVPTPIGWKREVVLRAESEGWQVSAYPGTRDLCPKHVERAP